ncbi:TPA: hypothetical protein RD718_002604 [Enterococcus faecium]|uniref:hypothetical protein n=1 Tax=Enterococcus TaxID=1350 RepID=UPI00100DE0A4|nr:MULTISPECIES: hypothetical protein [Enterococcus]KAA9181936.1 hypothetical protein F6X85_14245 [Enterococcus durans]RXW46245.1 hypothetical protein CYQ79_12620 [Enterococcus faecium]HCT6821641.1 hypothetical protein [Enterococcus faecium]HDT8230620.1 hypothetical protein [Enterococcus faecium]
MASSGRFKRMYHAAVTAEVLKLKRHYSNSEIQKKLPNIVLQCYFETQQALKEHQEKYHEFGLMDYYEQQSGLINSYHKYRKLPLTAWNEKIEYWEIKNR